MYSQTHLITFLTVLQTGSFSRAAAELGYTASAVSQQIAALESSIGLRLFDRGPKYIKPTSAALLLADRSRDLISEFKAMEECIVDISTGRSGRIRIGAVPSASAALLPDGLQRFIPRYPGAEIMMEEDSTVRLRSSLLDGDYDLIVVSDHGGISSSFGAEYTTNSLVLDQMLLLVRENRPDGKTAKCGLAAFAEDTWAAPRVDPTAFSYFDQICALAGFAPRIRYRSANFEVLRELVRVGVAVATIPALAYRADPGVSASPLEGVYSQRKLSAVYRRNNNNPLLKPLLASLREAGAHAQATVDDCLAAFTG